MMALWRAARAMCGREWASMFATPLAMVFVAAFVASSVLVGFQIGGLFETGRADLQPFFQFHPWLFIVFMPGLAMRAWSDETRQGTLETLLGLPVPVFALVAGKFAAAFALAGLALALTFPLWIAVSLLGPVDHGATAATYLMSWLGAGAVLALGMAASAATSSQVVAFVAGAGGAFVFTAAGLPVVADTVRTALDAPWGDAAGALVGQLSLLDPFDAAQGGAVEATGLIYLTSFIAFWLGVASLLVDARRSGPS